MENFFHSVNLNKALCRGCTNCLKRCPTEAIRVHDGRAHILAERCIDCGECIKVCPYHAKEAHTDKMRSLDGFKHKIALPAPALYAQFNNLESPEIVLGALKLLGFDDVFEVAAAAEIVSDATRILLEKGNIKRPVISSACPAVTRLIRVRFPELIDNLLPLNAPVEVAARLAKDRAVRLTGLDRSEIATVFISPCPAKVTAAKSPLGTEKSDIDAVIAIKDIYPKLLTYMKLPQADGGELNSSGRIGIGWGSSGGEASATLKDNYLAADGIENVMRVLEDLEDEKLHGLDFVELNACSAGCVGGILNVENPYIAKVKLKKLRKYLPVSLNHTIGISPSMQWDKPIEYQSILQLDPDVSVAMQKMSMIEKLTDSLPGLDCGSCGCPTCRTLAEDVVCGYNSLDSCIIRLKSSIQSYENEFKRLKKGIKDDENDD